MMLTSHPGEKKTALERLLVKFRFILLLGDLLSHIPEFPGLDSIIQVTTYSITTIIARVSHPGLLSSLIIQGIYAQLLFYIHSSNRLEEFYKNFMNSVKQAF